MERFVNRTMIVIFALIVMLAGIAGMFFCLPFLYSSRMEDLVGAGFPFLAGAVMLIGGMITIAIVSKKEN